LFIYIYTLDGERERKRIEWIRIKERKWRENEGKIKRKWRGNQLTYDLLSKHAIKND
jgi:hypothetical protein